MQWGEEVAMLQLHVATFGAVGEEELHRGGGRCSSWLDYENNVSHLFGVASKLINIKLTQDPRICTRSRMELTLETNTF